MILIRMVKRRELSWGDPVCYSNGDGSWLPLGFQDPSLGSSALIETLDEPSKENRATVRSVSVS